ncbi:putative transcription factor OFP family [Helianthus annuus]|uniref:Transcription repressor n=1 Tax=Helianthus annuus TaxID=4232 RepID=A0A251S418_HELAN|nr:transcription repressor OFP7 [Helianthus annuus]KAF5762299.1 putative transcription factor OFP family [Helianthus annuus]KAJ0642825.1 putative transcription factor OFP family [Helianthus annuus]KAJ0646688.1 putative transcription factor OFP family [Helianthus annuus]
MVKFKLKIFRSCRSKDPSTLPNHPIPTFQRHNIFTDDSPTTTLPPPKHHQQPHRSSFKSHVSSAFGCGSKSGDFSDSDYFHWQEDDHWHVIAKIYDVESPRRKIYTSSVSAADTSDDNFPLPLPLTEKKKRRRSRKLKLNKLRRSISSDDSVLFTREYSRNDVVLEDETETESLISCDRSRSFSTDSSTDFNPQLETIRESACISLANRYKMKKKRTTSSALLKRTGRSSGGSGTSPEYGTPARLSVFKKLIPCEVEGKMKESFAMVKRSADPYDDFKRSMMEMIVEKQMFEEGDLEQLLQCYLSLNSRVHHRVIVEAFSEIWDTMFGGDD